MATFALAGAGAVIGSSFGYASWGWMIGSTIGSILFAPESQDTYGQKLNEPTFTGNVEGSDLARLWGVGRVQGNPIWIKTPPNKKTKTEGGGGKFNWSAPEHTSVTYSQDFALCFGEFEVVPGPRRIWANQELIYDASGDNPEIKYPKFNFQWYDGTRGEISSLIEQDVGDDNCPAYTNRAVMIIEGLNLTERFGNRIPVIEAEFYTGSTQASVITNYDRDRAVDYDYSTVVLRDISSWSFVATFDPTLGGFKPTEVWRVDMAARYFENIFTTSREVSSLLFYSNPDDLNPFSISKIIVAEREPETSGNSEIHVLSWPTGNLEQSITSSNDKRIYLRAETLNYIFYNFQDVSTSYYLIPKINEFMTNGIAHTYSLCSATYATSTVTLDYIYNKFMYISVDDTSGNVALYTLDAVLNIETKVKEIFVDNGYTESHWSIIDTKAIYDYVLDYYFIVMESTATNPFVLAAGAPFLWVLDSSGDIVKIFNFETDYGVATGSWGVLVGDPLVQIEPVTRSLWWRFATTGTIAMVQIDALSFKEYDATSPNAGVVVPYPNRGSVWTARGISGDEVRFEEITLDNVDTGTVLVNDIFTDILEAVGVSASDLDLSATSSDSVPGFMHLQSASARTDLEAILQYINADMILSDWKIKTVKRGNAAVLTVPSGDLGVRDITSGTSEAKDLAEILFPMSLEVPRRYTLEYISVENKVQKATAVSDLPLVNTDDSATISLPLVLTDADAKDYIETVHQQINNPLVFKFTLSTKYIYLEPTDTVVLTTNNETFRVRLTSMNRGINNLIECEAVLDEDENYVSNAVSSGREDFLGTIIPELQPYILIIDGPLLEDSMGDDYGPLITSYVYSSTYIASFIYYSFDNESYKQLTALTSQSAVGFPAVAYNTDVWEEWDDVTAIVVNIVNGANLSSTTKAAILNDPTLNAFAYGVEGRYEYLNVATVTLLDATYNTYLLTNLLRGRRGTNNYINQHSTKDTLIKLTKDTLIKHTLQNSQSNNTLYYKLPSSTQYVADVVSKSWAVSQDPKKPYSPIEISTVASTNVIINPNFEDLGAGDPDIFSSWVENTSGTSTISQETSNLPSGYSAALRLNVDSAGSNVYVTQTERITVVAGTDTCTFKIYVRQSTGTNYCGAQIRSDDGVGGSTQYWNDSTTSWQDAAVNITFASTTTWQQITINLSATNTGRTSVYLNSISRIWTTNIILYYTGVELYKNNETSSLADVSWTRRTRIGGSLGGPNNLTDGVGGPISEDSESYEIDIVNVTTGETLNTTPYTNTDTSWTYSVADQITDGANDLYHFYVDIYQMSAIAGRGFRGRQLHVKSAFANLIKSLMDNGPLMLLPLDDADETNPYDHVTKADITGASFVNGVLAGFSLVGDERIDCMDTTAGNASVTCDDEMKVLLDGKTEATISIAVSTKDNTSSTNDRLFDLTKGGAASRVLVKRSSAGTYDYTVTWEPKDAGSADINLSNINDPGGEASKSRMFIFTTSIKITDTGIVVHGYFNGNLIATNNSISVSDSQYASNFQAQTRNAAYDDTIGADTSGSNNFAGDALGYFALYDRQLSHAQVRSIYESLLTPYYDLLLEHESIAHWTLDDRYSGSTGSIADVINGITFTRFGTWNEGLLSYILCSESMSETHITTNTYLYTELNDLWKLQDITVECWFYTDATIGTNAPVLALLPRNAYTDGRGIELRVDATNGLRGRIGTASGWVEFDAATANVSSATTYLFTFTVSSTGGVDLYLNGANIATTATTYTIRWDDGGSNGPNPATFYVNAANQSNASQVADVFGHKQTHFGHVAIYEKASTSAEILARYNYGVGTV